MQDQPLAGNRVFQLTEGNANLHRVVDRDENGIDREEKVCTLAKVEKWVDPKGNICDIPMQCGRVLSHEPEAQRYEDQHKRVLLKGGQLPLHECPYTTIYRKETGTPALVKVPKGETECEGHPEGCSHMRTVIESRRARARKEWEAQQANLSNVTSEQAEQMMRTATAAGFAAGQSAAADARRGLTGKGEPDKK